MKITANNNLPEKHCNFTLETRFDGVYLCADILGENQTILKITADNVVSNLITLQTQKLTGHHREYFQTDKNNEILIYNQIGSIKEQSIKDVCLIK